MPYCPTCSTEYVEGTTECEDCGAKLLPGAPPSESSPPVEHDPGVLGRWLRSLVGAGSSEDSPPVKTVRIRTFSGPTSVLDAELARNLLEAQGIPVILPGQSSVEMLPFLQIPLLVAESDAERAAQILRDYLDSPDPNRDR